MLFDIRKIAACCNAQAADVKAALAIMGKAVYGDSVYFSKSSEITLDLILEIDRIRAMNQRQRERQL